MKEKKFNVDECNDVGTLKGRIMFLESNMEGLSRQIGGYKTANERYRKQVKELKERVEHYKGLDVEGDELYEKKIAECEELQKQLDMANLTINELRGQIASYNNQILEYKDKIEELKGETENLHELIKYEKTPWWKKIF